MTLSIVIPVYSGEKTIGELNKRLKKKLDGTFSYNIIMVCDGATTKSCENVKEIAETDPEHAAGYYLAENRGQHRAILYGIEKSTGDFIITLDDDLQHDPVFIKQLVEKQREGDYDVVYALFRKLAHPPMRAWASGCLRRILVRMVPGISPYYSPFRLIRRETAMTMLQISTPYIFIDGLLGKVTSKFGFIEAEHLERNGGGSSYNFCKLIKHGFGILVYYSRFKDSRLQYNENRKL